MKSKLRKLQMPASNREQTVEGEADVLPPLDEDELGGMDELDAEMGGDRPEEELSPLTDISDDELISEVKKRGLSLDSAPDDAEDDDLEGII